MRQLAADYAADDGRFLFGATLPKCSVDGWYDKVQQSPDNYTQLYWDVARNLSQHINHCGHRNCVTNIFWTIFVSRLH